MAEIGLSGFLDILFMWFVVYALMVWAKRTRSASILTGILIVAGVYLLTRQLNMVLTAGLLEKFFAIILITLVVIFKEELRYFFEHIAERSLRRRRGKTGFKGLSRDGVDVLVKTVSDLAKERTGALIVIKGEDLIVRHLDGGIDLDGKISEALLKSIFDASSMGHDGAVYIEGGKIMRFSCHLPLSKDLKQLGPGGTRHAAALGLAELCDALCLVVSEERGAISVARRKRIKTVADPDELREIIEKFYEEIYPKESIKPWEGLLKKNSREKVLGLLVACVFWFVIVYGARQTYKTFRLPVSYTPLESGFVVEGIQPDEVYITLGGPRNAFLFLAPENIKLKVHPESEKGIQKLIIYPSDFEFPKELTMEVLTPQEIYFSVGEFLKEKSENEEDPKGVIEKVKKVLPLIGSKEEGPKAPAAASPKAAAGAVQNVHQMKKTEVVSDLADAKPEEVVKYLEKTLEGKPIVETLKSKKQDPNMQEGA